MGKYPISKPIVILIISFAVLTGFGERYSHAQFPDSGLASILPLNSLQGFFGPLLPPEGISSTFRSELGVSGGMATLMKANITNGNKTFNLVDNQTSSDGGLSELYVANTSLDGAPPIFQFYSKTRLWRLAFNASYTFFNTHSRRSTDDGVFFSGLALGGDLDLIHNSWLSCGLSANFYFQDPQFTFKDSSLDRGYQPPVPPFNVLSRPPYPIYTSFTGSAPSNIGVYLRYTPPEILNFPVHVEAHYYMPFMGSKWVNWGLALAFRPQIYRFDLSARLKIESQYLKFSGTGTPPPTFTGWNWIPSSEWEGEFTWSILGMDVGVYF